ncbi:MAG: HNH endonuclease signature motif containing protein [Bacteroidia bacterium]|nr:HNH endonuclease signature motif containing protein [Bacteroidia bacterium]
MTSKKRAFIINVLRRASFTWWSRTAALKKARVKRGIYRCNICKYEGPLKDFEMDHVIPVIGKEGFTTFDEFIERLFPDSPNGWQLLCKPCHTDKTNKENEERRDYQRKKK